MSVGRVIQQEYDAMREAFRLAKHIMLQARDGTGSFQDTERDAHYFEHLPLIAIRLYDGFHNGASFLAGARPDEQNRFLESVEQVIAEVKRFNDRMDEKRKKEEDDEA